LFSCNLCFDNGVFPEKLKISKIIPVFKKGSRTAVSNYRPISITSPFAKLMEKLMYSRLITYLDKFNLLYDYQFGFRKNFSTLFAVIDVVNIINEELFDGKLVMGIFMDLQKAFDTVNIDILVHKLEHYGVRGTCLSWFKSYLINRSHYTVLNGIKSDTRVSQCGVPQGTVLGPLLFLIYINDISNVVSDSKLKLFADDSNLL